MTLWSRRHQAGVWHVDFVGKDDLVVSAVPGASGTEVVLTSLRDGSGFPPAAAWTQFLGRLEKLAARGGSWSRRSPVPRTGPSRSSPATSSSGPAPAGGVGQ
jgi:hypothetical protein